MTIFLGGRPGDYKKLNKSNMDAKEARLTAEVANERAKQNYKDKVDIVLVYVKKASEEGKFSITISEYLHTITAEGLRKLGYKVKLGSHRNESYTTISW